MNTKSLLPALKKQTVIKVTTKKVKSVPVLQQITDYEQSLNKMWQMYQDQLQRNFELMEILSKQQQQMGSGYPLVNTHPQQPEKQISQRLVNPAPYNQPSDTFCNSLSQMPYDQLRELTRYFRASFTTNIPRLDALHSVINLLHYLNQMGGEAAREELITATSLSESSIARYTITLRELKLATYVGTTRTGRYKITELGIKFLNGQIQKESDLKLQ